MDNRDEIRIQKYISDCGIMSRRAAEKAVSEGRVTVNGTRAEIGMKVTPGSDDIRIDGSRVENSGEKVYILLNKPEGYLTSMSDDRGRNCVSELVKDVGARVYPCGRLDLDSRGLLVMTNDGELANKITHPGHGFKKTYHVRIKGEVTPEDIAALSSPMEIDGYRIKPVKVWLVHSKRNCTELGFQLGEGRNRQIRKMCEKCGLEILSLERIGIGPLNLGSLKPGEWRHMSRKEINSLVPGYFDKRKK